MTKIKAHCMYSQLENKLLIKVINIFIVYNNSHKVSERHHWRTYLQQTTHKTPHVLYSETTLTFSRSLHVISMWNTRSVYLGRGYYKTKSLKRMSSRGL